MLHSRNYIEETYLKSEHKGTLTLLLGKIFDRFTVAIFDSFSLSSTWTVEMVINMKKNYCESFISFVKLVKMLWVNGGKASRKPYSQDLCFVTPG